MDAKLLDILQAHGQSFLDSFEPHNAGEKKRKCAVKGTVEVHHPTKLARTETDQSNTVDYSHLAEEWTGFGSDAHIEDEYEAYSSNEEALPLEGMSVRFNGK
jgi:hypothetical protein